MFEEDILFTNPLVGKGLKSMCYCYLLSENSYHYCGMKMSVF